MGVDLSSPVVRSKVFSCVMGLVAMILGFMSYTENYGRDEFFVGTVTICVILSVLNVIGSGFVKDFNNNFYLIDLFYHGVGGIIVFISGCVFTSTTLDLDETFYKLPRDYYNERITAAVMAMLQAVLFGIVVYLLKKTT